MRATIRGMLKSRWAISAAITLRLSPSVTATKPSAPFAPGPLEDIVIDPGPDLDPAREIDPEPFECGGVLIDDRNVVCFGD